MTSVRATRFDLTGARNISDEVNVPIIEALLFCFFLENFRDRFTRDRVQKRELVALGGLSAIVSTKRTESFDDRYEIRSTTVYQRENNSAFRREQLGTVIPGTVSNRERGIPVQSKRGNGRRTRYLTSKRSRPSSPINSRKGVGGRVALGGKFEKCNFPDEAEPSVKNRRFQGTRFHGERLPPTGVAPADASYRSNLIRSF